MTTKVCIATGGILKIACRSLFLISLLGFYNIVIKTAWRIDMQGNCICVEVF
jgi:hypothetical protein